MAADHLARLVEIADAIDSHEADLAMLKDTRASLWVEAVAAGHPQKAVAEASRIDEGAVRRARRAAGDTEDRRGGDRYEEYRRRKAAEAEAE